MLCEIGEPSYCLQTNADEVVYLIPSWIFLFMGQFRDCIVSLLAFTLEKMLVFRDMITKEIVSNMRELKNPLYLNS